MSPYKAHLFPSHTLSDLIHARFIFAIANYILKLFTFKKKKIKTQ